MTAETFTPDHVALIYQMYRKALRKFVNSNPTSSILERQYRHWQGRWAGIPAADFARYLGV